ncbi:MAG: DUF1460 domain-containing protein [Prevotella sp.]|nr:DUF1460 domain-containing protein [Prevotella sp.]
MQSCANGGASATSAGSATAVDSSDAKQPAYRIIIESLLRVAAKQDTTTNYPLFFARKFLNVPYVAHTLEVNDEEELVINVRELDCTTLVETVTALTLCIYQNQLTFTAYQNNLRNMRYYNGVIDRYPSRIHYFTDWIMENSKAGIIAEIQQPNPPFTQVQTVKVNYMSQHPQSYKALKAHPEYVAEIARMEQRLTGQKFRYIPKSEVRDTPVMREAVHDGDIIAITCNKPGLDIAHLGLAVWREDGLHLLNASQLHKKVVEEPMTLYQYLQQHPSHTGIRIIRINHK